ncbi:MAG: AMP-binding protein [Candidatus Aminicenantes bacterium]|nr:AMP-binding protein [Candidatus Aminicenantes bacterium]NIM81425.1 AMP-binding protein [Candidatus Aminicenantes bacterium]NIN20825.1 AMP-binding protein [Candidatus Aminicenantes bacterium]NIN44611.1 AMP-binding protein [Candidatus Aminicenantes bacterium]NIN87427.1 AMP-binding protein [Candidatus Aminicenantes bacterium]
MLDRSFSDRLALAAAQNIKERDYWLSQLSGELVKATFPYDYKKEEHQRSVREQVEFRFSETLFEKIMKLSNGKDVKLHMILVTGLFILLHKYSNGDTSRSDIMVGSPILTQEIDSEFINRVLVFRNPVEDHVTFKELLLQVRETIIQTNENQNYPMEILLEQLGLPAAGREFPLFDVVILLESLHDKRYIEDIQYNMLFSFSRTGDCVKGFLEYNSLLYHERTVKRITRHYMHVLDQVLADVNRQISRIDLLTEDERQQVLFDFNDKETEYPQDKTIHELFEEQAERTPDGVALVGSWQLAVGKRERIEEHIQFTYRELNRKSNQLAHLLREKGVRPDTIVGIMVEPCIEMFIGILGILKSGGVYLPIDPDYPQDTVIQLASFAFDVFVEEVFPILLRGGKILIPHLSQLVDMNLLSCLILKQAVSIIDCTPLLLNEFNKFNGDNRLGNVRLFISGGDVLKREYVDNLLKIENAKVYNTYGPTESTICAAYYDYTQSGKADSFFSIPIGTPVSNYRIYILDRNGSPVPIGVTGELCVSGAGITRGYLNRPELTAEKFIEYRSYKTYRTYRSYKTGDLARWLEDGNIEFSGRIDHQVKIRGFRIELGEIENHLCGYEGVKEAVVTARGDETGDKYLCAYIVSGNGGMNFSKVREYLLRHLPAYMVPAHFVLIDDIPLNRNGKVDRKRLPVPEVISAKEYVPPRTAIEKQLTNIYSEILQFEKEKIGVNDDFFELGGNSLRLIKLTTRIHEVFNTRMPMTQIFRNSTIKQISNHILGSKITGDEEENPVLLNKKKEKSIFCFPPAIGYGLAYMEFAAFLEDYSVYAFNFIEEMEKYIDAILRIQPEGPFVLLGYSAGGKLCLKAANLLEKKGYNVSHLILVECYLDVDRVKSEGFEDRARKYFNDFRNALIELKGEFMTEKALRRVKNYQTFFARLDDFEPVDAPIHFIKAEDKAEMSEPLGWERLTTKEYRVYNGFGKHEDMLSPAYVERNAEVIRKILD